MPKTLWASDREVGSTLVALRHGRASHPWHDDSAPEGKDKSEMKREVPAHPAMANTGDNKPFACGPAGVGLHRAGRRSLSLMPSGSHILGIIWWPMVTITWVSRRFFIWDHIGHGTLCSKG